jgi:aminoglycoside/choline kinase family phosphotransferase
VLDLLIKMQILGAEGFETGWCWQGARYDVALCVEKEAGYFLDALVRVCLGLRPDEALESAFMEEARAICNQVASGQYSRYFLHRDFQSRNMMLRENQGGRPSIYVIDFQAGRLGPPLYDLASVLHDPYVELPWSLREELLDYYLVRVYKHLAGQRPGPEGHGHAAGGKKDVTDRAFCRDLFWKLSLMRLLQAAGAYGYLSTTMGRRFFRPFIAPALRGLKGVLSQPRLDSLHAVNEVVEMAITALGDPSAKGPGL